MPDDAHEADLESLLEALGRTVDARDAFAKAISLDPREPAPYLNLARSWLRDRRPDKARSVLEDLLDHVPGEPRARELLRRIEKR